MPSGNAYSRVNWMRQVRRSRAAEKALLTDVQIPLSAIALEVGFADQSHLTKALKRGARTTPGE
jgi:AraC family transcriptional regulator